MDVPVRWTHVEAEGRLFQASAAFDPKRTVAKGRNCPKALPHPTRSRPMLLRTLFSQRPCLLVVEREIRDLYLLRLIPLGRRQASPIAPG